jgi:hypothetical protein
MTPNARALRGSARPLASLAAVVSALLLMTGSASAIEINPPGILDCPLRQPPAGKTSKPNAIQITKVIRCLFEKKAPGGDGYQEAIKVDVTSLKVGASRPWQPALNGAGDIGSGGRGTTVYPFKTSWRITHVYVETKQIQDNISVFNCYVNSFKEWECGLAQRIKDGPVSDVPRT